MFETKLKSGLAMGTAILSFAGLVAGGSTWFTKKFSDLDDQSAKRFEEVNTKVLKLETAIKVLSVNQTDDKSKELIKQLLAKLDVPESRSRSTAAPVKTDFNFKHEYYRPGFNANGSSASAPATSKP
jgi:hypothetical protein